MKALSKKALRMIRGKGENAVTHYSCGVVDKAREDGVKILVVQRDSETGEKIECETDAKKVHRDLRATFGDTHENAGEGKFIALEAFPRGDNTRIVGAQHVNPYLKDDGVYATIVETLKNDIGVAALSRLRGSLRSGWNTGTHILWEGRRNSDGWLAASGWFTEEDIFAMALETNPSLLKLLRKSKSGVKGASHKSAKEKFIVNLEVLRRATCVVSVMDGKRKFCGGVTPYSKPLEQAGFAIDKRFLTYDVDDDGGEIGRYFYRLVVGRSEPHILPRTHWQYEGVTSTVAFKDNSIRRIVRKAG